MKRLKNIGIGMLVASTALWVHPLNALSEPAQGPEARDGQHDFDFNFGTWKTHIKRILDPLSGSTHAIELNGTVTVRKVWGGRGQLEEIEADGPNGHWEGLTLFLYNPQAHQWSQTFANSKNGSLTTPTIGAFKNGRGELFSADTLTTGRSWCAAFGRTSSRTRIVTRNRTRTMAARPGPLLS